MQQSVVELIVVFLTDLGVTFANIANGTYAMSIEDAMVAERLNKGYSKGTSLMSWLVARGRTDLLEERLEFWNPHTRQGFAETLGMAVTFVVLVGDKEQNIFERYHLPQ